MLFETLSELNFENQDIFSTINWKFHIQSLMDILWYTTVGWSTHYMKTSNDLRTKSLWKEATFLKVLELQTLNKRETSIQYALTQCS